jgi:hypothetical protein
MSNLQDGQTYPSRPTGAASVYENDKGSLVVCLEIDVQGEMLRYYAALATVENGINTKTVERLKAMFGWDGIDPFWFVDNGAAYAEREVEATIELKQGRNGDRYFANIKYLDPPGGGSGGGDMPAAGNRAGLLAKYGSKFRAIAGGVPAAKPSAPPVQKTLPQSPPPPPAKPARKSDQMECWAKYCEAGGTEADWFKMLAEAVPGVDQGDLTPAQWGLVLDHVETNLLRF